MKHEKVEIITDSGISVEGIAPVIISASRSTDIPAFYADWFINRLKAGYCVWTNPFNHQSTYVSFQNTKVVVFWTKNPEPMIEYLPELDRRGIHYYFQITLNDYEEEGFEPNVPPLAHRIEVFKRLSDKIGKEKVIWRFDPLIMSCSLTPRKLLTKIYRLGNQLQGYTDKLVFSFADISCYKKVRENLINYTDVFTEDNVLRAEPNDEEKIFLAEGISKLREYWKGKGWNLSIATCAENIDLDKYGIEHNRCIDGELMERLFPEDNSLICYLRTCELPKEKVYQLDNEIFPTSVVSPVLKDKGQRKACGCIMSKDIGTYSTCPHLCAYCYANSYKELILNNYKHHKADSESII